MKRRVVQSMTYLLLVLLAVICLVPFLIMMISATQSNADLSRGFTLVPGTWLIRNYQTLVERIPFWSYVKNSLLSSVPNILLTAYFGTLAAYGFEKFKFRGKKTLYTLVMMMMIIPAQISLIGLYRIFASMKLLNTLWVLILPGISNVLTVYWMRGNIYQLIDDSLLDAAKIDGCGEIQIFHKIVLPLCKTGILTISIMNFVSVWNDYVNAVTYITSNKKSTLSVGIAMLNNFDNIDLGAIYMGVALSTLVILLFYLVFNSQILGGVTEGSVKG